MDPQTLHDKAQKGDIDAARQLFALVGSSLEARLLFSLLPDDVQKAAKDTATSSTPFQAIKGSDGAIY